MRYTHGTCRIDQLRHRLMSRGMRSVLGTTARRALTELLTTGTMVGVGVVDWESGHAATLYPMVRDADGNVVVVSWYFHANQAADTALDYRERPQIQRVTHYPARTLPGSERLILTDGVC